VKRNRVRLVISVAAAISTAAGCSKSTTSPTPPLASPTIVVAAYPILTGNSDPSGHGVTLTVDGQPVTTTYTFPGTISAHPRLTQALSAGTHTMIVGMTNWDSLLINVGSDLTKAGGVDAASFAVVSSSWSSAPFSTVAACSGRVLFAGRSTGSITITFKVVTGTDVSRCAAPPTTL
jgi:hypothetical protein